MTATSEASQPPLSAVTTIERVAMVMVHTSPLEALGAGSAGGLTVYVLALAEQLADRGVAVDIFTRRNSELQPEVVSLRPGVRVVSIEAGPTEPVPKDDLYCYLPDFASEMALFSLRDGVRYDVVHTHYWLSGWVGHLLKRYWNAPVVHMYHTLAHLKNAVSGPSGGESPLRLRIERELLRLLDFFVAPNPDERAELVWGLGAHDSRICTIPPGIDMNKFQPSNQDQARKELGLPDAPIVLFVGRIDPIKDLDTLLEAFARIEPGAGQTAPYLAIIGGDACHCTGELRLDAELQQLQQRAEAIGIDDRLLLLGSQPQEMLPRYYSAATVCVMPSLYESFGLVVVEAMACGLPVIATRVGGMRFTVEEGASGLLVPRRDPARMAEAIEQVIYDRDLHATFQIGARQAAIRFSWHTVGAAVLSLYERLVEGEREDLCCYGEIYAS